MDTPQSILPPHNTEAEAGVIGCLLLSTDALADTVGTGLDPSDFYHAHYRECYKAICDLTDSGTPVDLVILKDELDKRRVFGDGFSLENLARAAETAPTASHAPHYAVIVRDQAIQRKMLLLSTAIGKKTSKGEALNGELDELAALSQSRLSNQPKKIMASPAREVFLNVDDEVDFILYPILARGCLTQLQGDPKSGKSCFSIFMAIACASGRWTAGRFKYEQDNPSRVVYISYEDNNRRLKRRVKEYIGGLGLSEVPDTLLLFGKNPEIDLSTKKGEEQLRRIIEDNQADVIILDTLSYLHTAEENSKKEMQPVMAALRRIVEDFPVAVLMIHHTRKGGTNGDQAGTAQRGRGSSAIAAAPDIILDWGNRPFPNVTRCALESKETTKGVGREFDVHYNEQEDGTVLWEVLSELMEQDRKVEGRSKVLEIIVDVCKENPDGATIPLVSAIIGEKIKKRTVAEYFDALEAKGKIHPTAQIGARGVKYYKVGKATLPESSPPSSSAGDP